MISKISILISLICLALSSTAMAKKSVIPELLTQYQKEGATSCSAEAGKALWLKEVPHKKDGSMRSCVSCHNADVTTDAHHITSKKLIKAMAPSVSPTRYTKVKKVEKWFKRNCKWTYSRECTVQEKCDFLMFLKDT